ncbi:MAG TPA: aldehyde dehydrogenase family protein [Blastocatellia bacterium]|nr:aldehyde dehydrogenase family protein [Blastocatellia bacterium]HMV86304.1 aldehyde dehydrogenase family protein [Blastocatellia bacterium]HMX29828.1 aldehyde dehydrogenase family protein [Blastocatellia bacterium]HMZ19333.1 aldehyde dehydrogenase family protein [Blastocatellia bacterium]HNG31313.1 aldehyde dehydrogenase family protein [Blastocatellia bacterium]
MAQAKQSTKTETYKNYIAGRWVKPAAGQTMENRNPADTRELIGMFPASTDEDVEAAVAAAREAAPKWKATPAPKRAEMLYKLGQILIDRKEQYSVEMTREMGKVLKEARGDVQEAIDMTFYAAGEGRRLFGYTTPSELQNKMAMCVRQPVGLCAMITPWNFPMAIPSWKMMPALVCGNTLVIKPAEDTPLSTVNLVKAAEAAGIPPGVINVVMGRGEDAGAPLTTHRDVRLVSFTGSTETGRIVSTNAAQHGKICSLEMGGKNVIMVMDDADIDLAAEGTVWGAFGTSGQRCTASSRIVVHKAVYKQFVEKLTEKAKALRVGNGLKKTVEVGPVINQAAVDKILGYIEIGKSHDGATLHLGGNRLTKGELKHGFFIEPTIFTDVAPNMRIAQEEIFGPVLSIIPCNDLDEAIEIGNGVKYGLSSSIYTQDVNQAFTAMERMYTGIFYVNSATIGAEVHLPFGGTKATGNGHREGAMASSLDIFSEWKAIYVDYSGRLQKAQIDEFKPGA